MKAPYQILPVLAADEHAALRADIEANGVRIPVDVDEQGNILDGHHRVWICRELGIDCPRRVLVGLTDEDKIVHAVAVNVHRRHLSREQRRELVAQLRGSGLSARSIGRTLNVDHTTVLLDLRDTAPGPDGSRGGNAPPDAETVTGADGKAYPARKVTTRSGGGNPPPDHPVTPGPPGSTPDSEQTDEHTKDEETTVPQAAKRRPLPTAFREAVYELSRALTRVERLAEDDRFTGNRAVLSDMCRADLTRATEVLTGILGRLPDRSEGA